MSELNAYQRVEDLAEKHIDGSLSPEESSELESLVTGDEELAMQYAEFMRVHAMLYLESDRLPSSMTQVAPSEPEQKAGSSAANLLFWLPVSVAASFLLAFFLFRKPEVTGPQDSNVIAVSYQPVALIESADFAQWGDCTLPTAVGQKIAKGKLELKGGLATLTFNSGARLTLEAPVAVELIDDMTVRLSAGSVVSDIPESAHGFTILTPTATAIDHGTRFVTRVDENGETNLQVLDGEVELVHGKSAQNKRLKTGQGAIANQLGIERQDLADGELAVSLSQPDALLEETVTITTAQGGGRDGTTVRTNTDHHYNPAMIMVKHCKSDYYRKGYAGFDLSVAEKDKPGRRIKEAKLVLNFIHSGYGIAAFGKHAKFTVYGVIDDTLDDWPQGRIKWQRAPANVSDEYAKLSAVQLDKLTKVGTFSLPRGKLIGVKEIATPELASFLRDDQNRYATFLIVCHTRTDESRIVYAIAGKRHPFEAPPTLHLRYE